MVEGGGLPVISLSQGEAKGRIIIRTSRFQHYGHFYKIVLKPAEKLARGTHGAAAWIREYAEKRGRSFQVFVYNS